MPEPALNPALDELQRALGEAYTIDHEIGRGGMAVVYHAKDHRHNRDVAIKILHPEIVSTVATARFLQEIEIGASLTHPNIVPLYDSGQSGDTLYYVMPYIEGETLRVRLDRDRQLSASDVVSITADVAGALLYAHERGIVHRDIKPENILLSSGRAVVTDFGIARAILRAGGDTLTSQGHVVGTAKYMSPEQAGGESVDERSDIYALGCVVYEMLAGSPPFDGSTAQAVIAQQIAAPAPSVRVVRPDTPSNLVDVLTGCLAKVPADRFPTVEKLLEALAAPERPLEPVPSPKPWPGGRWIVAAVAAAAAAVALGVWFVLNPALPLDANKVVVFPLREQGLPEQAGVGEGVSSIVLAGLEFAAPLKAIDPWDRLGEAQRADGSSITSRTARRISRERGADRYIDGLVQGLGDSVIVTLNLHDVAGDSLIVRRSARGLRGEASAYRLGIDAVIDLLPPLIGQEVDLTHLRERDPSAIALWIQGEKLYRRAQFGPALDRYRRTIEVDSALAFAAVKGAQAASWQERSDEAQTLIAAALRREDLLPPAYRHFAHGIRAFLVGEADTAIARLEQARALDPEWEEVQMALGEVLYHQLPGRAPPISLAAEQFRAALTTEPAFTPPLFHLTEIAARAGDVEEASELMTRFLAARPDSLLARQLQLVVDCVRDEADEHVWRAAARVDSEATVLAAKALAVGGARLACAERGFRSVLEAAARSEGAGSNAWGALLGLQGLLVAQGRWDEALVTLDAAEAGNPAVRTLYILDALAGAPMESRANETAAMGRRFFGEDYGGVRTANLLWTFAVWHARHRDAETLEGIHRQLLTRAEEGTVPRGRYFADAVQGHLELVRGDTLAAIAQFQNLNPRAHLDTLAWRVEVAGPVERLTLAELLLATNRPDEAIGAASVFDHQGPIIFLPFLPASLSIRLRAAEALEDWDRAEDYRNRLIGLGRIDLVDVGR